MNKLIEFICNLDHSDITSNYCPRCGKCLRPMREPGEIQNMKHHITTIDPIGPNPIITALLLIITKETLRWVLNEVSNENFIAMLINPKGMKNT